MTRRRPPRAHARFLFALSGLFDLANVIALVGAAASPGAAVPSVLAVAAYEAAPVSRPKRPSHQAEENAANQRR